MKNHLYLYHILAVITVSIWGTTFISTKLLLANGLSAEIIFFHRFLMAYICMFFLSHKRWFADNLKDEFMLFLCGMSGGSIYFVVENTALGITLASNVALIVCTAPIFTILFSHLISKSRRIPFSMITGTFIALAGVGIVVSNGNLAFQINPLGDGLSLIAAILWAIYCLLLKNIGARYPTSFLTRKIFFYGLASISIYFLFSHDRTLFPTILESPTVWINLIFLGIGASLLCYLMWNITVKKLGAAKASNYLYLNPLVTMITAAAILGEPITTASVCGAILIIGGVFIAER